MSVTAYNGGRLAEQTKKGGYTMLKINKIYAIDTTGKYPVALVRYENCSPSWRQYQNDKQIKNYLSYHNNYEINSNKKIDEYL